MYETISTFAPTFWTHIISELGGVEQEAPDFIMTFGDDFDFIQATKNINYLKANTNASILSDFLEVIYLDYYPQLFPNLVKA